jgi:hypothetical protein
MMRSGLFVILASLPASAAEVQSFLKSYCIDCHGPEKQKAERRFDQVKLPAATADAVHDLQDIVDQLNLGDMPPKKSPQPSAEERKQMVEQLSQAIAEARAKQKSTGGETVLRRLNRREYRATVGDLFALDMRLFDPTALFPKDQLAEHSDVLGDTLQTSSHLLGQYLQAADRVVEQALGVTQPTAEQTWHFKDNFIPQAEHTYPHRAVYQNRYLCVYEVPDTSSHEGGYVPIHAFRKGVPADGLYEIKVRAQAMNRVHPYDPKIIDRDAEQLFRMGIVVGDLSSGPLHHPQPIEPELARLTLKDGEPEWHTLTVPLMKGQTPRFTFPNGMADSRDAFGQIANRYKDHWPEGEGRDKVRVDRIGIFEARRVVLKYGKMPHIRVHEVIIRGPLQKSWPPASHATVLGEGPFQSEQTEALLTKLAERAYRRPVTGADIAPLMRVVAARKAAGADAWAAFKDGIKAMLCSPSFLYLQEPPVEGQLDAHGLATRLSYFLTSSTPDAALRSAADEGKLELLAQTERLLGTSASQRFVEAFLDSWLHLRSLGDMPPDRDAFSSYYSNGLQAAMRKETQLFFADALRNDAPLSRFLDADYSFVNRALAQHYQLPQLPAADQPEDFMKVTWPDGKQRGGLLGHGSILTVSANGIETSPVRRGVWLLENILGTPTAPPPDDVPEIDPDTRGAKTMREVLQKHRDSPACMECHQKIDPLGFAMENYDPVGRWRSHYNGTKKKPGPVIDPSGQMPSGEAINDVADLRRVLLQRQDTFSRLLCSKLLTHALGRRMEDTDRPAIDAILKAASRDGQIGLRSLIKEIVQSQLFRRG